MNLLKSLDKDYNLLPATMHHPVLHRDHGFFLLQQAKLIEDTELQHKMATVGYNICLSVDCYEQDVKGHIKEANTEVIELLEDLHEYFNDNADADWQGDPGHYVPNEEMNKAADIRDMIEKLSTLKTVTV